MQHKILALHAVGLAIVAQWSAAHVVATSPRRFVTP